VKISIIGSGIAGLAAAIRLADAGHSVHVFESKNYPGGKLLWFEQDGYTFDGGPSLFTMPHYVDDLLKLGNTRRKFEYEKQEVSCLYHWEDGNCMKGFSNPDSFASEAERIFDVPKERIIEYFEHAKNIYDNSGKIFLEKSLRSSTTWLSIDALKSLLKITQFDIWNSMHEANYRRLQEPHLVQLFDRFATYNGSNPYRAPGILNVIPWLEHGFGTFFPKGGMRSIPTTLYHHAVDLGVTFHFDSRVESIDIDKGRATGLRTIDSEKKRMKFSSDIIVSNNDVYFTYKKLMPKVRTPEKLLNQERSGSAVVFYWGIKSIFPKLGLHNIFFSSDYKEEFKSLFEEKKLPDDPTIYINISSKLESSDAPNGCENWFVMINAPANDGQNWDEIIERLKVQVIKKLSRMLRVEIGDLIDTERIWSPLGIESDTNSYKGALYGTSSNDKFSAFLRHPNKGSIPNVYFCGGSVHPGGGIPLALLSAKITSEIIAKDDR
jgi:phytoene desaturase